MTLIEFAMIAGSLLGGAVGFGLVQLVILILLRVLGIGDRTHRK